MSGQETVILVDEQDNDLGVEEKLAAHRSGKLHRAFSVFILRQGKANNVELLLQQREKNKYHCGGLWTNACCSHPRKNETAQAAAVRRLQEEVGFTTQVYPVGSFIYKVEFSNGLIEHELDHTFVGLYGGEELTNFNREEVENLRWVDLSQLLQELKLKPTEFTPWLGLALELVERQQNFLTALALGQDNPAALIN